MDKKRDATIDIAKCIVAIAIVLGHVQVGLGLAGILDPETVPYEFFLRSGYMWHMPMFSFMAGLFVRHALQRDGVKRFLRSRCMFFLYLYLVWSLIQGGVKLFAGSLVNSPDSIMETLAIWRPDNQFWFLPFLIVMTTAAVVMRPWQGSRAIMVSLGSASGLSLAAWGINGPYAGTQGLGLTAFYFAGLAWGAKPFLAQLQQMRTATMVLAILVAGPSLVAVVFLTDATPPNAFGENRTVLSVTLGVVASCAGVVTVLAMSHLLARLGHYVPWLVFIGQRSLEVFLAHIIATAGMRILLSVAGIDSPIVHFVAGSAAGVSFPLLLWWVLNRINFPWLFKAPTAFSGHQLSNVFAAKPTRSDRGRLTVDQSFPSNRGGVSNDGWTCRAWARVSSRRSLR